jgi:hypothetical protein
MLLTRIFYITALTVKITNNSQDEYRRPLCYRRLNLLNSNFLLHALSIFHSFFCTLGISARNSLQYTVYSLVKYNGAEDSMYMKQDLQATGKNNHIQLLPCLFIATPAFEQLIIITILMAGGGESKT